MTATARAQRWLLALIILAWAMCALRLADFTRNYAVNVMFWDQWDFYTPIFELKSPIAAFLQQHGPHRQGLGGVFLHIAAQLSGWDGRVDSALAAIPLAVAAALALWLKFRIVQRLHVTDVLIPLLLMHPNQYETVTMIPNLSHSTLPLALIFAIALCWQIQRPAWRTAGVVTLNFLLAFTGFGLFGAFCTPVLFVLEAVGIRSGARATRFASITGFLVAAFTLFLFFQGWQFLSAVDCFQPLHHSPPEYLLFGGLQVQQGWLWVPAEKILSPIVFLAAGLGLINALAFGVLAAVQLKHNTGLAFLLGSALLFVAATAYGRVCLDPIRQPLSSKYLTLVLPGVIALYIWACQLRSVARGRLVRGLFVAQLAIAMFPPLFRDAAGANYRWFMSRTVWKECLLASRNPLACDVEAGFPIYPDTKAVMGRLHFLESNKLNLFKDLPPDAPVITFPGAEAIVGGTTVAVRGTIDTINFSHYEVMWGAGEYPTQWNWISGPHKQPVTDGPLTEWTPPPLPSGRYTVRAVVYPVGSGRPRVAQTLVVVRRGD